MISQQPVQPTAELEIINVKNIEEFEEQIWKAVSESDIPVSEMHFTLQRIAHMILEDSYKRNEDDED